MGKSDESALVTVMKAAECFAYPFQVSVDQLIGVEMVEAARDANQLSIGYENRSKHHRNADTHKTAAIDLPPGPPHVVQHVAIIHPLGNHAELKQPWCNTFDAQNVFVSYSLADGDLFAVSLGMELLWEILNAVWQTRGTFFTCVKSSVS